MSHGPEDHPPIISFYDRNNISIGELSGWVDLSASWKWNSPATAVVVVPDLTDLFPYLAKCRTETVLVAIESRLHWTGRVTDVDVKIDRDKRTRSMEITMVDDWAVLQALLGRQNPLGGLPNQGTAEFDERTGPAETVVKGILNDVIRRLDLPIVISPAPQPDPSPIVTVKLRMDTLDKVLPAALEEASLGLNIWMHRQGGDLPESLAGLDTNGKWIVDIVSSRNEPHLAWDEEELVSGTLSIISPGAPRLTVGGEGEGVEKTYTEVVDENLEESLGPYRFREAYVDDSDGTKTAETMRDAAGGFSVSFSVDDGVPWRAGIDFRVGDFGGGTVGGVDFRSRIEEIELTADDAGDVRYVPKIGKSIPPPEVQVARAVARINEDLAAEKRRR